MKLTSQQREVPRRYEQDGKAPHKYPDTARQHYHQAYNEAYDLVMVGIRDRFDQHGYEVYKTLKDMLLKSALQEDFAVEMSAIVELYKEEFDYDDLKFQLSTMSTGFKAARQEPAGIPITVNQIIQLSVGYAHARRTLRLRSFIW